MDGARVDVFYLGFILKSNVRNQVESKNKLCNYAEKS